MTENVDYYDRCWTTQWKNFTAEVKHTIINTSLHDMFMFCKM